MHDGDPQIGKLIGFAQQLEGVARNASTHAAGVVISREPLTELMPLQKATNSDALMTQYEMHGIEALGLLKFDFLGLSNLTILRKAVDLIREHRGVEVDLDNIPLDDPKTFELLASGETTGVFQLESAGMRRYVRELQPTSVFDLAAMVALYRPGPMDNIPAYIRRKHGQEPVVVPPPAARAVPRTGPTGSSSTRRTSWPRPWPWAASRGPRRTRWATRSARRSRPCCGR